MDGTFTSHIGYIAHRVHRISGYWESTAMTTETKKNLRTAAGVIVWVAMLALSQESAAMALI